MTMRVEARRPGMRGKLARELEGYRLPDRPGPDTSTAPVTDADLERLPPTVQRYLGFMRCVGRPRDWSFRIAARGRFRRSASEWWMACESWQYNTRLRLARVFLMRMRFFGIVPVIGRDTYVDGSGRLQIRLLDLITVGDGTGEAFDVGELVTYLNDAILLSPSMLLVPQVQWSAVDDHAFDVALTDCEHTVHARVSVDERGAPTDFETTDRFFADPKDPNQVTRCRWTTPLDGYRIVGDRPLPTGGRAIWHPTDGPPLEYVQLAFRPETLAFNVAP
jgi:hypothetical protein